MGMLGYMVGSGELDGGECSVTWWGVGLCGGDCWVALWGVLGYMMGVLSYIVESVGLHGGVLGYMVGIVGLHDGSVGLDGGMLGYMEGSVGLPSDSPIREHLFNTGWGVLEKFGQCLRETFNPPLYA